MQFRVWPLGCEKISPAIAALSFDKRKVTNSARGFGNECFTERRFGETVIDFHPGSAVFHFAWRSRLQGHTEIVESTGSGQSRVQSRIENAVTIAQKRFHMFKGETLQKIFWCHARPRRKEPVKMKRAQPGAAGQLGEVGLICMMSIQIADHVCYSFVIVHGRILPRVDSMSHPVLAAIFKLTPARRRVKRLFVTSILRAITRAE